MTTNLDKKLREILRKSHLHQLIVGKDMRPEDPKLPKGLTPDVAIDQIKQAIREEQDLQEAQPFRGKWRRGDEMSKMYLPAGAIRSLGRYLDKGCEVELIEEEFEGRTIHRWIADGELVLFSAELEEES